MKQTNWAYWIAGQAGVIPLAMGMPGVAKTESTRALAKALNRRFLPIMLDQILPEDLGGYPVVRDVTLDGQTVEVMRRILDEKFMAARLEPSVMLIDELTNTGHSTQAAALQLMAEGIDGCLIYAAANPTEQAAAGVDLTPPMVNRLCVLQWEIDRGAIYSGWRNGLNFPAPNIPLLPANWRQFTDKWGSLAAAFMSHFPELLDAYPKEATNASKPFPSPRSWTNAIKLLGAADSVDAGEEVRSLLLFGCVGQAAGVQFLTWLTECELPDPENLLARPASLALPRRGDLAVAVVKSVIGRVVQHPTGDRWEACRTLLEHAFQQNEEIGIAAQGDLWRCKPKYYQPQTRTGGVATRISEILIATV